MPDVVVPPKVLPVTPDNYPPEIPSFASEAEEREFWDTHDSEFYFAQGVDASLEPPPPDFRPVAARESAPRPSRWTGEDVGQLVTIRFTSPEFNRLRARAEADGMALGQYLRRWVNELLGQDADQPVEVRVYA